MRKFAFAVLFLALFAIGTAESNRGVPQRQSNNAVISLGQDEAAFLILSDIHFDPLTGTDPQIIQQLVTASVDEWKAVLASQANQSPAPDGADANYSLLLSALEAARNSGLHYDYVLVAGDFLPHNFPEKYRRYARSNSEGYEEFVIKTMLFVSQTIQQAFPSIPIYAAFGNNDSVLADYASPGPRLLAAMKKEWKVVADQPSEKKDFLSGGYYVAPHPTVQDSEFIVLNTSYWSSGFKPDSSPNAVDAGSLELDWLTAQLDRLHRTHRSAAILMHIPPGIDAYASSKPGRCAMPALFWKKPVLDSFLAIVASHKDVLRDAYAGHTHIDDFRLFTDASGVPYFQTHIAPSISRDHHNPPGFEIGIYGKKGAAIVDYAANYFSDSTDSSAKSGWRLAYDFRQESHIPNYSPESLQTLALLIRSSEAIRLRVMQLYGMHTSSVFPVPMQDWRFYSCAQTELDSEPFRNCACPSAPSKN
jgi:sphingomyelin phosphodiesterase acid-like 3